MIKKIITILEQTHLEQSLYFGMDSFIFLIFSLLLLCFILTKAFDSYHLQSLFKLLNIKGVDFVPLQKNNILWCGGFLFCLAGFCYMNLITFYAANVGYFNINLDTLILNFLYIIFLFLGSFTFIIFWYSSIYLMLVECVSIVFLCFSVCFILKTNNFISFYLYLEIIGLILYCSASLHNKTKSSLFYAIMNVVGSAFLLTGIHFLYLYCGSYNFSEINLVLNYAFMQNSYNLGIIFSISFILFGIFVKMSVFPFHSWGLNVFSNSCDFAVILYNILSKPCYGFILFKLCIEVFISFHFFYSILFCIVGFFSIIIGTVGAIRQNKIKDLLAYSSLASSGFFLFAFIDDDSVLMLLGCLYLVSYAFLIGLFFLLLTVLSNITEFNPCKHYRRHGFIRNISDLNNVFSISPTFGNLLIFIFFSLVGLPPFLGFITKVLIIMQFGYNTYFVLMFFILIISIPMSYYYLELVRIVFNLRPGKVAFTRSQPFFFLIWIFLFFTINISLFLYSGFITSFLLLFT